MNEEPKTWEYEDIKQAKKGDLVWIRNTLYEVSGVIGSRMHLMWSTPLRIRDENAKSN